MSLKVTRSPKIFLTYVRTAQHTALGVVGLPPHATAIPPLLLSPKPPLSGAALAVWHKHPHMHTYIHSYSIIISTYV